MEGSSQFSRLERLIGIEAVEGLHAKKIMITGAGAVGGWAFESLVRSGVGTIRIVDFDVVELSNINRQVLALHSTLGMKKVEVAKTRAKDIWPACHIEAIDAFIDDSNAATLVDGMDLVIDCVDNVDAKIALAAACEDKNISFIASMGAALRRDPLQVKVAPLSKSHGCPLAKAVRLAARRRGIRQDFKVVFSPEPVKAPHEAHGDGFQTTDERRKGGLGSLTTVTAVFGQVLATLALEELVGKARFHGLDEAGTGE